MPVDRPPGKNTAGIVAGLVTTPTDRYPEGMTRVALFGDPTKALGSVSEPECALVMGALDLAEEMQVPVEWFALSSGAKISMDSGTENMDWVSRVLRRLITFTQAGGEVNVVVAGINVGAQPYWNAEATMLLHTKGILVMTPDSAMVLTGKQSLDYSGGVSAEDNYGIGGYDRVMGPNGQAQYWAPNLAAAIDILFAHYDHAYVAPGESSPRRAETEDPVDRDVRDYPHEHPISDFTTVGDICSAETNPERKKAFDIRTVMRAVVDQDHDVLERWAGMADADTTVVLDAHLGRLPRQRARHRVPTDPAPGRLPGRRARPVDRRHAVPAVVEEDRSGDQRRQRQPSAGGAGEPVRASTAHRSRCASAARVRRRDRPRDGQLRRADRVLRRLALPRRRLRGLLRRPQRQHGGDRRRGVLRVRHRGRPGSRRGVRPRGHRRAPRRTPGSPSSRPSWPQADEVEQAQLRLELADLRTAVRSEKLGEVAEEFEKVHNIERARAVGSVARDHPRS